MDYDILAFTETHLDGNVCNDDIMIENYDKPYRKDRTCHGGGLLIYINNNLAHERMDVLEIFWDKVFGSKLNKTVSSICLVYFIVRRRLINLFSNA